jgi:uncharacterized protein YktA (UPF0223 family)
MKKLIYKIFNINDKIELLSDIILNRLIIHLKWKTDDYMHELIDVSTILRYIQSETSYSFFKVNKEIYFKYLTFNLNQEYIDYYIDFYSTRFDLEYEEKFSNEELLKTLTTLFEIITAKMEEKRFITIHNHISESGVITYD